MNTATSITVEEYLSTSYEDGDREYVDGEVVARNLGEIDHGELQGNVYFYLRSRYGNLAWAGVEIRVQVKATRYRVPDVTVVLGSKPDGRVVTAPPFIVIEILSPEDRASRVQEKINDYLEFGVANVWVIDPEGKSATAYTRSGVSGVLRTVDPMIELPLAGLF